MPKLAKGEHIILHAPTGPGGPGGPEFSISCERLLRQWEDTRIPASHPRKAQFRHCIRLPCNGNDIPTCAHRLQPTMHVGAQAWAVRCKSRESCASPYSGGPYTEHNLLGVASGSAQKSVRGSRGDAYRHHGILGFAWPCNQGLLSADTCQAIIFVPTPELALQAASKRGLEARAVLTGASDPKSPSLPKPFRVL